MTTTLGYSAYTDPGILEAERREIFDRSWQYVGNTSDLAETGACLPIEVNRTPVVLTRDASGIHALVNVCAHRGSIVCTTPSTGESLTCPYHAWRYGLDGTLLTAPRSAREPSFEPERHHLESLRVGEWGPFLFVALSEAAPPFDTFLADLPEKVEKAGIEVETLRFHHRSTSQLEANWKVCVENFLECYHCRIAHPEFSRAIDTSADGYQLSSSPGYSTQVGPVRTNWTGAFDPVGEIPRSQFHLLYPNTAINILPGAPNLSIGPISPTDATRTHRFLDYFFSPDADPEWIDSLLEFDARVGAEDVSLVEGMQIGLAARPGRRGTLFMDSERLIAAFEDHLTGFVDYP